MTTLVTNGVVPRLGSPSFGASLGQDPRGKIFRNYSEADKRAVARDAIARVDDVDALVNLLRFVEYLQNTTLKATFALKGFRAALDEVSKDPAAYDRETVNGLQVVVDYLRTFSGGLQGTMRDDLDVPRDSFLVDTASFVTFGIIPTTFPTKLSYLWAELLDQIPNRLRAKIVVERWTGPAPSRDAAQQFEAVEFAPPAGDATSTHVLSDGARTSLYEDALVTESYAADMEKALRDAGVLAAVQAIPWFARFLGKFVAKETAKRLAARAVLAPVALAKYAFTIRGAVTLTSLAALYKLGAEILFSDVIPKVASAAGEAVVNLAESAANAMAAVKSSVDTIVVIAGVAVGITLVGGAVMYVTR